MRVKVENVRKDEECWGCCVPCHISQYDVPHISKYKISICRRSALNFFMGFTWPALSMQKFSLNNRDVLLGAKLVLRLRSDRRSMFE